MHPEAWSLLAVGAGCWALGTLVTTVGRVAAVPELLDNAAHIALVSATIPLLLTISLLVFSAPLIGRVRRLLDSALAAVGVGALCWHYVLGWAWHVDKSTWVKQFVFLGYPFGGTLVLVLATFMAFSLSAHRPWRAPVVLMALGLMVCSAGALLRSASWLGALSGRTPWMEIAWPIGAVLIILASNRWPTSSWETLNLTDELMLRTSRLRTTLSLAAPHCIALVAFGIVAGAELGTVGHVSRAVFIFGCGIAGLVGLRQVLTMAENHQLSKRVAGFNVDLEHSVEQRTAQLHALYALARSVGNSLELEDIIEGACTHTLEALRADGIVLNLTPFAFTQNAKIGNLVHTRGIAGREWILDQLDILDTPWHGRAGTFHSPSFTSHARYLVAPILCKQQALGWIAVVCVEGGFETTDLDVLSGVGLEMGAALENARLYSIARQMADIDSVSGLLNHRAIQQRFDLAFEHATDRGEPLTVLMLDLDNFKHFNDTYGHIAGDRLLRQVARLVREGVRPHDVVARYGGDEFMVLMPDTDGPAAAALVASLYERASQEGFPEPGSDRVIPFGISIGQATYPTDTDKRAELAEFADRNMYATKREREGASPGVSRSARPSERDGTFDLLHSMVIAVDNKDLYTRAHSEEVAEYAVWIAQEHQLGEDACRTIRRAALLHDVGKIGVPDEILRKPGHLSDEEMDVMRQHPVIGAMIVGSMPGTGDVLPGIRHHHEQWDGAGYPDGLVGEQIPVLGRILAVADGFSALTTDRPYRKGMPWPQALERIREASDTHYDPQLVELFARAIWRRLAEAPVKLAG